MATWVKPGAVTRKTESGAPVQESNTGNINEWVASVSNSRAHGPSPEGSLLLPWEIQGSHFSTEARNLTFKSKVLK